MKHYLSLKNYAAYRTRAMRLTPDELSSMYNEIKQLITEIGQYAENPISEQNLWKILQEKRGEIKAFGLFLLDFQGFHDKAFQEQKEQIEAFTKFILVHSVPFAEAEYRLLEICQKPKLALFRPERGNLAEYILSHVSAYSRSELQSVYRKLKETPLVEMCEHTSVVILYNICQQEIPLWQRF